MAKCKNCIVGILSVCSLDYCRPEREALLERALELATRGEHTLGEFAKVDDYPIWQARCVHCGRGVSVNLDPAPGKAAVYGEAAMLRCRDGEPLEQEPAESDLVDLSRIGWSPGADGRL